MRRSKLVFTQQYLSYYSTKHYVVGTQKNRLTETIPLITHTIGLEGHIRIWDCEILFLSRALDSAAAILSD